MEPIAAAAAREVARELGLQPDEVMPLRVHDAATLLFPADRLVLRLVPQSNEALDRASRAVRLTSWLAAQGFPTNRPAFDRVIVTHGYVATVWHEVSAHPVGSPLVLNLALGRLLRDLHALPAPPITLPTGDPLARLRAALRLDSTRARPLLDQDEANYLGHRVEELTARYAAMDFPLGSGLIHNDAHFGNLIAEPASRHGFLLTDWEGAAVGPRELDVVLVGAPGSRFGDTDDERLAFVAGYGHDIAAWPDYQILRDIRDLHSLAAYIRSGPDKPPVATELHRRIHSLRADDRTVRWVSV